VTIKDWSRQFGEKHGQRDRAAALDAQARIDVERQRHAERLERWPAIVAAMRSLIAGYNRGAGIDVVTLAEDVATPGVTVESATNGRRALVVALESSELTVRSRSGPNQPLGTPHWVTLDRTDENAAAYLLRDWMERLQASG
jgi:hypothetical protein